ncbi:MAG: hypothetical protein ABI573_08580 [Chloroflexota bacterium]
MIARRLPVRHRIAGRLLVSAVIGLVGACATPATPAVTVTPTATPLPTPVSTAYVLDATAWYAGLIIHFDAANSVLDEGGGAVMVDLRLENLGTELATLEVGVLLGAGGRTVEPIRGTVIPDVPPGASVGTTLQFNVDGTFDVANAAIWIGRADEHRVIVPLEAGTSVLTTLEPVSLSLAGSATAGTLTVTLTGGELRADLPDWGLELASGSLALTITYTARYRGDFAGGFPFTGVNVGLRLPDGTTLAARPDGHSQSVAVLKPGTSVPNLQSRFEVPLPAAGAYALVVRDGARTASIPFTIAEAAPGG